MELRQYNDKYLHFPGKIIFRSRIKIKKVPIITSIKRRFMEAGMSKVPHRKPVISARHVLLAVRKHHGLSQRKVEQKTGIQSSTISDTERGLTTLGKRRLARLGAVYQIDPRALGAEENHSAKKPAKPGRQPVTDGQLLKLIRKLTGLSQAKVGELIGTKAPNICMIENGKTNLGPRRAARLIKALKIQFPAFSALWN